MECQSFDASDGGVGDREFRPGMARDAEARGEGKKKKSPWVFPVGQSAMAPRERLRGVLDGVLSSKTWT